MIHVVRLISVCNSERIIKIGQYLSKLCSNKKGSSFFLTHSVLSLYITFAVNYQMSLIGLCPKKVVHPTHGDNFVNSKFFHC